MNRLADFERGNVHVDDLGQILGQAADLELEEDVLEHAAAGLYARGFAHGLDWHLDGDLLGLGNLVEVHMQDRASEGEMLDFLNQSQALGARILIDVQIHQDDFAGGAVNEILQRLGIDLEHLGLDLFAIDDGRNAAIAAEFLAPAAAGQRAWIRGQRYWFHVRKNFSAIRFPA